MVCSFLAILALGCRLCGIHLGRRRYLESPLLEVYRVPNALRYLLAEGAGVGRGGGGQKVSRKENGKGAKLDIAAGILHSTIPVVRRAS